MEKEFINLIKSRRSIRKFITKQISKEVIEDIIDCARLAPSARNIQPWEFIVVTDRTRLKKIAEITKGFGDFIKDASFCVVVVCKDTKYYLEDGCAATMNILFAALSYGLGSCWVAGDKKTYASEILNYLDVPKDYKLVSIIAIGYPAEKPTVRKRALKELIHWESF